MRNRRQASRWSGEGEDGGNPDAGLPPVGSRAGSSATDRPPQLTITGGSRPASGLSRRRRHTLGTATLYSESLNSISSISLTDTNTYFPFGPLGTKDEFLIRSTVASRVLTGI